MVDLLPVTVLLVVQQQQPEAYLYSIDEYSACDCPVGGTTAAGDNKHAHCFKPDSEMSDQTQTWFQMKKIKKTNDQKRNVNVQFTRT